MKREMTVSQYNNVCNIKMKKHQSTRTNDRRRVSVGDVNKPTPFSSQSARNAFHARPTASNSLISSIE